MSQRRARILRPIYGAAMMLYLEQEIVSWAYKKGIINADDKYTQALKTIEEMAELLTNFLKAKDITDDIGDVYVTIAVQAHMNGLTLTKCGNMYAEELESPPVVKDTFKKQVGNLLADGTFMLLCIEDGDRPGTAISIHCILEGIKNICERSDLVLADCIEHSYNIITKRTGKMVDGVFVKD